jgi:hypothetical protein
MPRTPLKQGRNGTRSINKALLPATASTAGTVKQGVAVANATDAASALARLNDLLASLRTAGTIAT